MSVVTHATQEPRRVLGSDFLVASQVGRSPPLRHESPKGAREDHVLATRARMQKGSIYSQSL